MQTTITAMYNDRPSQLQEVVNKILNEASYSSGSSSYLISVANNLIKYLVQENPENSLVQGIFMSSIPGDLTNEVLDWETAFFCMKKDQNIFTDAGYFILKPLIEYLLGIKIDEDQNKLFGTAMVIAAIKHYATLKVVIKDKFNMLEM